MTSTEFEVARKRLGWSPIDAAVEYNLTPKVIEGFERGSVKVPKAIAREIRLRVAVRQRHELLAASGLPECSVRLDLDRAAIGTAGTSHLEAIVALVAHVRSCDLCRQRSEYADRYGPPLPEVATSVPFRIGGWASALMNRLPAPIRPPEGQSGDGRRVGFLMGGALSAFACALTLLIAILRVSQLGFEPQWWRELAPLGAIIAAYIVGFYVAGWAWDALRPIHHRFIGYVLR